MNGLVQIRRRDGQTAAGTRFTRSAAGASSVYVETYGCQMNVADTEMVYGLLGQAGYTRAHDVSSADVILLNTCAVREKAEERVFQRASMLARAGRGRGAVLGITGCMAEHLRGDIRQRAPYVDLIVGPDAYRRLPDAIQRALAGETVDDVGLDRNEVYEGIEAQPGSGAAGHIAVQRGCDRFCTFCIVPYTRGRERATPPDQVVRQASALVAVGVREVRLLGQTVNSYRHGDTDFGGLLRRVADVPGVERIRFTSPYPLEFSEEVIRAMAETPKVCKHVHLPLQSGSDAVLRRMNRGHDFDQYRNLVSKLREAMPDLGITTDLLVGFCGETEEEFQETIRAQKEIRFDSAFMFAYSQRSGTVAARRMPDDVPAEVKQRRLAEVIEVQRQISAEKHDAWVGRTVRVLVEDRSRRASAGRPEFLGRADAFHAVIIPAAPGVAPGAFIDVRIEAASPATLFGRALPPGGAASSQSDASR